jgi:hypothetical protein
VDRYNEISGAALGAVCGIDSRSWRRWVDGTRMMPAMARRLLCQVAGVELPWVTLPIEGHVPKAMQHADGAEVLVRLSNGQELLARWRQGDTAHSGWYVDTEGEPVESGSVAVVAVLPL